MCFTQTRLLLKIYFNLNKSESDIRFNERNLKTGRFYSIWLLASSFVTQAYVSLFFTLDELAHRLNSFSVAIIQQFTRGNKLYPYLKFSSTNWTPSLRFDVIHSTFQPIYSPSFISHIIRKKCVKLYFFTTSRTQGSSILNNKIRNINNSCQRYNALIKFSYVEHKVTQWSIQYIYW